MTGQAVKTVLVYSLSEVSQSDWARAALTELERLSVVHGFSLQVQTDTLVESFRWSMAETANPAVVFFFTPVLPDPRNRSEHVAVFRGRQPGTHDLVSLTDLKADCASTFTLGFAVDNASTDVFEAIFGSDDHPAIATGSLTEHPSHQDPYEATNIADDLRRIKNFVDAMDSVRIKAADSRRIWALITNRFAVTDFSRPHIPLVDPHHDASHPVCEEAVWVTRDRADWRKIKTYPSDPSEKSPFQEVRTATKKTTEFSVVSWVRLGNRPRQVWADTRSVLPCKDSELPCKDSEPWPTGPEAKGWLMGALQWDSPRPVLLFQLNAGGDEGSDKWRGQNFVGRGDVPINDGQWHSLTAVVRLSSPSEADVELWVDGHLDGPTFPPWNPHDLFAADDRSGGVKAVDFFTGRPLLLGESVDAHREGAKLAADFHGDLAAVGVYSKALEKADILNIRKELDSRIARWQ